MTHLCYAIGCDVEVAPRLFACRRHWYMLPKAKRDAIWAAYQPDQEVSKQPSALYVRIAGDAVQWLAEREGRLV